MTPRLPDPDGTRVVLVGCAGYADRRLPELPSVRANLTDLGAALMSEEGIGLPATHCTVVADPSSPTTVGTALRRARDDATDLFLVYYAGHGLTWSDRHELYLAMTDTNSDDVGTSALSCAVVRQIFLESAAKNRVLIVDCCFAGRAIESSMSGGADAVLAEVDVEGAFTLAATARNAPAQAPQGLRNTVFTGELLSILRAGLPGGPELITLDLLYRELRARLSRRNLPTPSSAGHATTAHLALARNVALIADRKPALDALAEAEALARKAYDRAIDRIADPGLPVFTELTRPLWTADLAAIREAHGRALRITELAAGLLERRDELRGRLGAHLALAARLGIAEDVVIAARHRVAHDLLWTKPCDLGAATRAVLAFQQSVTDRRERT
ncbi:MAG TPA: caspase family protein [Pseudonocardiaceae bacterium]|nr:caspase family protein [Pseudonocardiaceae bacterium]